MATRTRPTPRTFIAGAGAIAVIALVIVFGATATSGIPFVPKTEVKAAFDDVSAALDVGNDVRTNGVRVGSISAVEYDGDEAIVTLELNGGEVYANATAAVANASDIGKKFVELYRGTPDAGPLGDRIISASKTVDSGDLDTVLNVLDKRTREALTSAIRQAGGGVAGHSRDLHDLLTHLPAIVQGAGEVTGALASKDANLDALLQRASHLAASLRGHEKQLSQLIQRADTTMRAIGVDDGQRLQDAIKQLPTTLSSARRSFDALEKPLGDTKVALTDLRSGVKALGKATPDLRGVLTEGLEPLGKVPGVAELAEPAVSSLTKTVRDARPLVPAVSRGLTDAAPPVNYLAPYTHDVMRMFRGLESMTSTKVAPGVHGARVAPSVGGLSLADNMLPTRLLEGQNLYPAPGQAYRDRTRAPLIPFEQGGTQQGGTP